VPETETAYETPALRGDVCPLVPEHLRVILTGLHMIAAEVGELKQAHGDPSLVRLIQRFRALFATLEWDGNPFGEDEPACRWCRARITHSPSCPWVALMRDSARYGT
jgi:hypothetical protein